MDNAPDQFIEIERKFLLSAVPPRAFSAPAKQLRQGYLPGEVLIERVRHVRFNGADRYLRTVKHGVGVSRLELEEECEAWVFEGLWALTQGRRISKTRYLVEEQSLIWEIDVFHDRALVLAEVELTSAEQTVELPEWLSAVLVREVTGEVEFTNWRLSMT